MSLDQQIVSSESIRFHGIVGVHPSMQELYELIKLVAPTEVTVHISGESGVGKELVADSIHHLSKRRDKHFVKLNCSSIPDTLLESALFGHVRGAFTDAHRDSQGYVEYAHGGTIFLDEIGDISTEMQVKLLRLLQSKEYSRVGEAISRKADIRIITATNQNLEVLLERGKIREDFYYRVNVFPIVVPPLRDRREDIELLTRHFIQKFNVIFGKHIRGVSPEVEQAFKTYHWPGNIRELENAIEHAFVIAQGDAIEFSHLPAGFHDASNGGRPARLDDVGRGYSAEKERERVLDALSQTGGNRTRAAKILGISRVTLWKKMLKHHLFWESHVC